MNTDSKFREYQDKTRDTGWRIKWIPWQEPGRVEYVYNTPLTLFTGFGGAALFIGAVIWLLAFKTAQGPVFAAAITGLAVIVSGRIYAAFKKQSGWACINARCIDREIRQLASRSEGNVNYVWEYRVLCEFTLNGREYRATPEASHVMAFGSAAAAEEYLNMRIQPGGKCRLWVDPRNPRHAIFDKKQRI